MALYDIGNCLCDSLCQPCNSAKPHKQREPLVINPVTDLSWLFVSACILDWNGLQYLIFIESYYSWFEIDTLNGSSSKIVIEKMKRASA